MTSNNVVGQLATERAVSLRFILRAYHRALFEEILEEKGSSTATWAKKFIIPLTNRMHVSWAEFMIQMAGMPQRPAKYHVVHSWSSDVRTLVLGAAEAANLSGPVPGRLADLLDEEWHDRNRPQNLDVHFFICALSVNQHTVQQHTRDGPEPCELGDPSCEIDKFPDVAREICQRPGAAMVLILDKDRTALTRTLCLEELHVAVSNDSPIELLMCGTGGLEPIRVDGQAAQAYDTKVKHEIDRRIQSTIGFDRFNEEVTRRYEESVDRRRMRIVQALRKADKENVGGQENRLVRPGDTRCTLFGFLLLNIRYWALESNPQLATGLVYALGGIISTLVPSGLKNLRTFLGPGSTKILMSMEIDSRASRGIAWLVLDVATFTGHFQKQLLEQFTKVLEQFGESEAVEVLSCTWGAQILPEWAHCRWEPMQTEAGSEANGEMEQVQLQLHAGSEEKFEADEEVRVQAELTAETHASFPEKMVSEQRMAEDFKAKGKMDLLLGLDKQGLLEKYELEESLREGGYWPATNVYKGRCRTTGRIVKVKAQYWQEEDEGVPFTAIRECAVLKQLADHPNIVKLLDIYCTRSKPSSNGSSDCTGGTINLVFEFVGINLKEHMKKHGNNLSSGTVCKFMLQMTRGVFFLHTHRIIHRNLRPQGIFISPDNVLKLCDFNTARAFSLPIPQYTEQVCVTWYKAPEVLLGSQKYALPVDIWSIGCILGEMAQGIVLFRGDSEIDTIYKIFQKLGTPSEVEWPGMANLADWKATFPRWRRVPWSSSRRVSDILGERGIQLLDEFLQYDPRRRISAQQALSHAYLTSVLSDQSASPINQATDKPKDTAIGTTIDRTIDTTVETTDLYSKPGEVDEVQSVVEYASVIYTMLRRDESICLPRPNYFEAQPDINPKMRAILVDWLVVVHMKYRLKNETLFLAVSLIDRFLDRQTVTRKKLQLVGITGMWIAAKFEEINPPGANDFVYICDKAYTKEDIVDMEIAMLTELDFMLCCPTVANFFNWYEQINECNELHRHLLQYILELALGDFKMIRYSPSFLVAAATLLSNKLAKRTIAWPSEMIEHTKHTERSLKTCALELCALVEVAGTNPLQAVRWKFKQEQYSRIGSFDANTLPDVIRTKAGRPARSDRPQGGFGGRVAAMSSKDVPAALSDETGLNAGRCGRSSGFKGGYSGQIVAIGSRVGRLVPSDQLASEVGRSARSGRLKGGYSGQLATISSKVGSAAPSLQLGNRT